MNNTDKRHDDLKKSEQTESSKDSEDNGSGMDSEINTNFTREKGSAESLTIQESPNTDPNKVDDKPSFNQTKE